MANLNNVLFAFVFIAFGGLLFGYIIGVNSNIITDGQLLCPEGAPDEGGTWTSWGYGQCYRLSGVAVGLLSSLNLIGACLSSLVCFRYADAIGRKREAQIGAVLYFAGALITATAPALWVVYAGLLVYGLGIGFAMHVAPVYVAEISPADVRGTLVSAKEAIIVLGMFLGFLSGYAFSLLGPSGWRLMIFCAAFLALAMLAGVSRVPQSPRYLVLHAAMEGAMGQDAEEEAFAALQFFRSGSSREEVLKELQSLRADTVASLSAEDEAQSLLRGPGCSRHQAGTFAALAHTRPLLVGCGLVILQQVTGQPSVLYYATNIFKGAGFGGSSALQAALLGFVKLVATLFTVWRVDRYGRRLLLLVGITMMVVALAVIAAGFSQSRCGIAHLALEECPKSHVKLPGAWAKATVAAMMVYVSGYQVGFGPISWLIVSEVFPLRVRGSALSVAAIANFASNILVTFSTATLMESFAPAGLFAVFLLLGLVSIAFVLAFVPETKGKTLEEIEAMMRSS